jgi:beta-xylosidase
MLISYKLLKAFIVFIVLFSATFFKENQELTADKATPDSTIIKLADPTIFYYNRIYYLYGTGGDVNNGFLVYTSTDLKKWDGPKGKKNGYALAKGDAYGTQGFWAPQVFYHDSIFYIAYTANEHIAIAKSDNPLGPFKQEQIQPISSEGKQIDPYIFFDDDGKAYLFHVRLTEGNRIFIAELKDDLSDIKPATARFCLAATDQPWENTPHSSWPVSEGPTVLKHNDLYYLFYSANDFRNKDYAVGYAVSKTLSGQWKKYSNNPIVSRKNIGVNGTGHGDFFKDAKGELMYVLHTHNSDSVVQPRLTALVKAGFAADSTGIDIMMIDSRSFNYLHHYR